MSRTVSAEPREPSTVENRTKTGVSCPSPGSRRGVTVRRGAVALEDAVRAGPAGVDHPLRDALVVEVRDLLAEVEVLQQRRATLARPSASGRCRAAGRRCAVVRNAPCWAKASLTHRSSRPSAWVSGWPCSFFGGIGPCGSVGSSTVGGALPGVPGIRSTACWRALLAVSTTFSTVSSTAFAGLSALKMIPFDAARGGPVPAVSPCMRGRRTKSSRPESVGPRRLRAARAAGGSAPLSLAGRASPGDLRRGRSAPRSRRGSPRRW